MLRKLRIQNFKCLEDTGELAIRPLTFLVGPNSSGKSSVLQALLLLRQTADSSDMASPLVTSGKWVEVGAYPDFISRHEVGRELRVEMEFSSDDEIFSPLNARISLYYDSAATEIRVRETEIWCEDAFHVTMSEGENRKYQALSEYNKDGERKRVRLPGVGRRKFFLSAVGMETAVPGLALAESPGWFLEFRLETFVHLGPLREQPQRSYPISGRVPEEVGAKGQQAVDVLWASHKGQQNERQDVKEAAQRWFAELGIAEDIQLRELGGSNQYSVVIRDKTTGVEANLTDIGFGASQVLPIVVQSLNARSGSTILIEQPEIHLHPKAQSVLGDLFIEAAQKRDRTLIVETHSEHILARVRRRIAEREMGITKDDVAIYYFEPTPEGTRIQEVTLNDNGQYVDFPEGFFEEDVWEAFAHMQAMQKNH